MKNGVYLLLGLLLVINKSANAIEDDNPHCKYDENTTTAAKCYHEADIAAFKSEIYVRLNNLSTTNILNLTLQTTHSPTWKWRINNLDFFKRFQFLISLQILGEVSFAPDLDMIDLKYELFNIATLKTLALHYNGFNSIDHLWVLPNQLTKIVVVGNDYDEFSVYEAVNLEEMIFHHTGLTSLPELPNPPPLLSTVDFRYNNLLEIDVDIVAFFCRASRLSLDDTSLQSPDKYCECIKMKEWINEIILENETNIFSKPLNCFNKSEADCSNNSMTTALRNRVQCLDHIAFDSASAVDTATGRPFSTILLYLGIGIVVLTIASISALVTYRYFVATPPAAPPAVPPLETEKQDEDRMDDEDMLDDYRSDDEREDIHESDAEVFDDEEAHRETQ